MKTTVAATLGLLVALGMAIPAEAATAKAKPKMAGKAHHEMAAKGHHATHYYVVKNGKMCGVTMKHPGKTMVGKFYYKSKADASHAMHRYKACKA